MSTSAPMCRIMRSVWSRDCPGDRTAVRPFAYSPAMRIADFTCALATLRSYSMAFRSPPRTDSGRSVSMLRPMKTAPISRRGSTIRPIGRDRRESSPVSTDRNDWPARSPATSRVVVPLLPAWSTSDGSFRPSNPTPATSKHSSPGHRSQSLCSVISTPSPRRQPSIDVRSSPTQKLETCAVPSAMELSSAARWEIDLSPAVDTVPSSRLRCCIVRFTCSSRFSFRCSARDRSSPRP